VRMNQRVCSVYAPTSLPSRYNYVYGNLELRESRTPSKMGFLGARMTDKNEIFHICGRFRGDNTVLSSRIYARGHG
jgi:hypothetical protein